MNDDLCVLGMRLLTVLYLFWAVLLAAAAAAGAALSAEAAATGREEGEELNTVGRLEHSMVISLAQRMAIIYALFIVLQFAHGQCALSLVSSLSPFFFLSFFSNHAHGGCKR